MSDDLDIRGGGAVAVDTATLRATADGFESLAAELDEIAALVGLRGTPPFRAVPRRLGSLVGRGGGARRRILVVSDDAHGLTAGLRDAAAVYEIVELRAERAAAEAAGDSAAVARIDARLDALFLAHPGAERRATLEALGHWFAWPGELARQASGALWWLTPGFHALAVPTAWALQRAVGALGAGTVPSGARLDGRAGEVIVSPVAVRRTGDCADFARGRGGADPRTATRGSEWSGTRCPTVRASSPSTSPARRRSLRRRAEPFDMGSSVELYAGERAASYDAALAALRHAGAEPGDVVHAFGHSQGAMVAAPSRSGGRIRHADTRRHSGRPIEADVGEGTLSIALRHSDDPVAAARGRGVRGGRGRAGQLHRGADG